MPYFRARALIAFENLSADNNAAADARAERYEYTVRIALARAEFTFAQSRAVSVVYNLNGDIEFLFQK